MSFHTKLVMFLMICTNVGATDPTGFRYGTCLLNEQSMSAQHDGPCYEATLMTPLLLSAIKSATDSLPAASDNLLVGVNIQCRSMSGAKTNMWSDVINEIKPDFVTASETQLNPARSRPPLWNRLRDCYCDGK